MGPKSKPAKEGDVRHQQEEEQVDTTSTRPIEGEGPSGTGSPAEGVVSELASMMKIMLQAQEVREIQLVFLKYVTVATQQGT